MIIGLSYGLDFVLFFLKREDCVYLLWFVLICFVWNVKVRVNLGLNVIIEWKGKEVINCILYLFILKKKCKCIDYICEIIFI